MNIAETNRLFDDNILSYAYFPIRKENTSTLYIDFNFGKNINIGCIRYMPKK